MRVTLFGANGQLGKMLLATVPDAKGFVPAISAYTSQVCDITDKDMLGNVIRKSAPDVIINAAAYTKVDLAETEVEAAFAANQMAVQHLATLSSAATRIIHVSTDFVFDGQANTPYKPMAPTAPIGVYGKSKLAGEHALLTWAKGRSCIVRTAWLYSAQGKNFVLTMLSLMQTREELRVVNDQIGTPTSVRSLARAIWRMVQQPELYGVFHWTDDGQASWYDFACEIQRQALQLGIIKREIPIIPVSTAQFPTPAKRPAYSVLDKTTTTAALHLSPQRWQTELELVLQEIALQGVKQD